MATLSSLSSKKTTATETTTTKQNNWKETKNIQTRCWCHSIVKCGDFTACISIKCPPTRMWLYVFVCFSLSSKGNTALHDAVNLGGSAKDVIQALLG